MTETARDSLAKALARLRHQQALRLNWRVIGVSAGVPFDSDAKFYYLQGHDNNGKPYGKPNYPVPSTIGFQHTRLGTYLFDTQKGFDGMPLFRGYTWEQWNK